MLSNKIIEHLKQQGIYSEKEDEKYKTALINLGIDLNSDFVFAEYSLQSFCELCGSFVE